MATEKVKALKEALEIADEEVRLCNEENKKSISLMAQAIDNFTNGWVTSKKARRIVKVANAKLKVFKEKLALVNKLKKTLNKELNSD